MFPEDLPKGTGKTILNYDYSVSNYRTLYHFRDYKITSVTIEEECSNCNSEVFIELTAEDIPILEDMIKKLRG